MAEILLFSVTRGYPLVLMFGKVFVDQADTLPFFLCVITTDNRITDNL